MAALKSWILRLGRGDAVEGMQWTKEQLELEQALQCNSNPPAKTRKHQMSIANRKLA